MVKYLLPYKEKCDVESLQKIINERESWKTRKGSEKYIDALKSLPISLSSNDDEIKVKQVAENLIPWRKGPYKIGALEIDSEWKSDLKWDRFKDVLENQQGKTILDIGCSNGYFMFQIAKDNPALIMGIDPVPHCYYQFKFLNHFHKYDFIKFELLGIEHVSYFTNMFDTILFMGIIYHHKDPIRQLQNLYKALRPGGTAILETIGIPGDGSYALFPPGRYANMRNVWFIPTIHCFENWIKKSGFKNIKIISNSTLTTNEQRLTKWCPPPHQSLEDFLDKNDISKTIEGHPAPHRFLISATK